MARPTIHPDLDPRKVINLTIRPWSIRVLRTMLGFLAPRPQPVEGIETTVQTLSGVTLRVHRPVGASAPAALLWIHGGGLIIGDPRLDDETCSVLASRLGITVIAVKYRLAPQHPFPAPLDDCHAAWRATLEHAEALGIDPSRVAIGGASAGGGLAACLALRIRDEGGTQPPGQLLVYPMLDDRTTTREDIGLKEHLVWNNRSNITGWGAYLGAQRGADTLPPYAAAARHDDLSGLPPAWIGVGTIDLFHTEDVAYAERLTAAGVPTTLDIIENAYHGFDAIDAGAKVSQAFTDAKVRFLREVLQLGPEA